MLSYYEEYKSLALNCLIVPSPGDLRALSDLYCATWKVENEYEGLGYYMLCPLHPSGEPMAECVVYHFFSGRRKRHVPKHVKSAQV